MGAWAAPAAATAFAAGVALAGSLGLRAGPGWALLVAGFAALVAAAGGAAGRGPPAVGPDLLTRAGLMPSPAEPDARQRILGAIRGLPVSREPATGGRRPVRARRIALLAAVALVGIALCGAGWSAVRSSAPERSLAATFAGRSVRAEAVLAGDPSDGPFGWSVAANLRTLTSGPESWRVAERVWLQGHDRAPPLETGDRIRIVGSVTRPEAGGFGDYLRSQGIAVTIRLASVERVGGPSNPLQAAANAIRRGLTRAALAVLPEREAGLLMGLALGDTSRLDPGLQQDFRATGMGHLVAVSGSNVAMFLAPLMGLAMKARLRRRGRFAVGIAGLVFFALLTRMEPSVMRASAMTGLTLLGTLLGRPRRAPAIMGASILGLLVWDPSLVHALGFQLSVAATAGIVAFAGPLAERIPGPRALAIAAGATIGAQATVTPLLLMRFNVVPTTTLPANLLAFPAVSPAMLLGLAATAVWLVLPGAGSLIARFARLPLGYLMAVADRMAKVPLPSLTSAGGLLPFVLSMAVVAWMAYRLHRRRPARPPPKPRARAGGPPRRVPIRLLVVLIGLPVFVWGHAVRAGPPSSMEVRFMDVGQGDAALVRSPAGALVLIDAGPDPLLVATKLAAAGVHRLDVVVATHGHKDHVEGFPAVFARFPVGLVLDPGCHAGSPSYAAFQDSIRDEQLRVQHPRIGEVITAGDIRLEVLGPAGCHHGTASDTNNDSIVLRVSSGGATVLFTGDAEQPAQEELLSEGEAALQAVVLKVPHHGGGTSLPGFLVAVHARLAVVSVGMPNDYGHPKPWVLSTLQSAGAVVYRTDQAGDVVVRFGPEGPYVESAA
jgi:competence protein ComEC